MNTKINEPPPLVNVILIFLYFSQSVIRLEFLTINGFTPLKGPGSLKSEFQTENEIFYIINLKPITAHYAESAKSCVDVY